MVVLHELPTLKCTFFPRFSTHVVRMAKNVNEVVSILKDAIARIEGEDRLNSQDAEHQPSTTPSTSSLSLSEAVAKDLK